MDNRPLKFDEFEAYNFQTISVSVTPGSYEVDKSSAIIEQVIRPTGLIDPIIEVRPSSSQVEDVLSVGDEVKIKLFEIDKQGRLNFSIKLLTDKPEK